MESVQFRYDAPFDDGGVVACAAHWARQLRAKGISDIDAEDLLHESWRLAHARVTSGQIDRPVAFVCRVIANAALMRMRRKLEIPSDPSDGWLAALASDDRSIDEVETLMHLNETLHFLDQNRAVIWARVVEAFGPHERAESMWAAAVQSVERLQLQDTRMAIDEVLAASMRGADPFWRADGQPGEDIRTVMDRRRKRVARDLPWVSFVVLYVAMRWALHENAAACRHLCLRHLHHVAILQREWKDNMARTAALERHVADVKQTMQPSLTPLRSS